MNPNVKEITKKDPVKAVCQYCHSSHISPMQWGPMYQLQGITVHYFCLLFSAGLNQEGEDEEGILGFMPADIRKEIKRGDRLKCQFCRRPNATIGCWNKSCNCSYHYPCGLRNGCSFEFIDNFASYCPTHKEVIPAPPIVEDDCCPICKSDIDSKLDSAVWPPCCKPGVLFHKRCMMEMGRNHGIHYFKCPLCNDKETFSVAMRKLGIYLPYGDAAWETVPNAFVEQTQRYRRCDAEKCFCPKGREHSSEQDCKPWKIIRCLGCGASAIHKYCGKLKNLTWRCGTCADVLLNKKKSGEQPISSRIQREEQVRPSSTTTTTAPTRERFFDPMNSVTFVDDPAEETESTEDEVDEEDDDPIINLPESRLQQICGSPPKETGTTSALSSGVRLRSQTSKPVQLAAELTPSQTPASPNAPSVAGAEQLSSKAAAPTSGVVGRAHKPSHHSKRTCPICKYRFAQPANLRNIQEVHEDTNKPWKCSKCPSYFNGPSPLSSHRIRIHRLRPVKKVKPKPKTHPCGVCGKSFTTRDLDKHMKLHTDSSRPWKCSRCPSYFVNLVTLRVHEHSYHKLAPGRSKFSCQTCGKILDRWSNLETHMRSAHGHTLKWTPGLERSCRVSSVQELVWPNPSPGNDAPEGAAGSGPSTDKKLLKSFYCTVCKMPMGDSYKLRQHMRMHQRQKDTSFKCTRCPSFFNKRWHLVQHDNRAHRGKQRLTGIPAPSDRVTGYINTRDAPRPYSCTQCGITFKARSGIWKHVRKEHPNLRSRNSAAATADSGSAVLTLRRRAISRR